MGKGEVNICELNIGRDGGGMNMVVYIRVKWTWDKVRDVTRREAEKNMYTLKIVIKHSLSGTGVYTYTLCN